MGQEPTGTVGEMAAMRQLHEKATWKHHKINLANDFGSNKVLIDQLMGLISYEQNLPNKL